MQIEEEQVLVAGQKHKIDTSTPDGHPLEFIPVYGDSPAEVNGAKRRKLSGTSERVFIF